MKLNCILIEDGALQRITITKLIHENENLNLMAEFSNAIDAKNFILNNNVALIFLDIEMPTINGFEFIDELTNRPQIIFISVNAAYALKAFDYDATDYLHKPLTKERFNKAVKKAVLFATLINEQEEEIDDENFIFIKSNLKKFKLPLNSIRWIEAYGDYIKIITEIDNHLVLSTMKAFESKLPLDTFVRIHKSYIVNIKKVNTYNTKFVEIDTFKIPMSRKRKELLTEAIKQFS